MADPPAADLRREPWRRLLRDRWARWSTDARWFVPGPDGRPRLRLSLERVLLGVAVALAGAGLLSAGAAAVGAYRFLAPILWVCFFAALIGPLVLAFRRRLQLEGDRYDLIALGIALLSALSAGLLAHRYALAQMDIGFYANDAFVIATTGGRALHAPYDWLLPGFTAADGGFETAAMFGYSSLAAAFAYAAGYGGTGWVNAPLAFVTVLALYRVGRWVGARLGALVGVGLYASSLLTVWFNRWIMTENASTAMFWAAVALTISLARSWDAWRATALALVLGFGSLVRLEGLLVASWFLLALVIAHRRRLQNWILDRWRRRRAPLLVGLAIILLTPLAVLGLVGGSSIGAYARANIGQALGVLDHIPAPDAPDVPVTGPSPNWGDYAFRYEWDSAAEYFLTWMLFVAVVGLALGLFSRKRAAFLALLCAPYLLFVLMPPVTTFHPWFMRRLWIAWIPLVYLLCGAALDAAQAAHRWPIRGRRSQPRTWPGVASLAVLAAVALIHLDIVVPIAFEREDDGYATTRDLVAARVPRDALLILDEDVVGFSARLRLEEDRPVISWFISRPDSFYTSIESSMAFASVYILRYNATLLPVLRTGPNGTESLEAVRVPVSTLPRQNLRDYLAFPPLEEGYRPLRQYLDGSVPPNQLQRTNLRTELLRARLPLVVEKNVEFKPSDWNRTPLGLESVRDGAEVRVNVSLLNPDYVKARPFALYVAYHEVPNGPLRLSFVTQNSTVELEPLLPSDGSGRLSRATVPLPRPLEDGVVRFPVGVPVRGVYLDLAPVSGAASPH